MLTPIFDYSTIQPVSDLLQCTCTTVVLPIPVGTHFANFVVQWRSRESCPAWAVVDHKGTNHSLADYVSTETCADVVVPQV